MFEVTKRIGFCYGHRLLDYEGKCRHLHGHNGVAEIELAGERLDRRAMLADFGEIRGRMKAWIDERFDHRMILRRDDPAAPGLAALGEPLCLIDDNPTTETLARMIFEQARAFGWPVRKVTFWETPDSFAGYEGEGTKGSQGT